MKNLLLIFTLLFSTMIFPSTSYAKWTKVGVNKKGTTFYVDFERISKQGEYVYWWEVGDRRKPNADGSSSNKAYKKGDCKLFRYKYLSHTGHIERMGAGTGEAITPKSPQWYYPSPHSSIEYLLKSVCSQ